MNHRVAWAGALLALAIAVAVFSRLGIDDELRRDEAIYAYGGQQLAQGVPPYLSILDPKTPLATIIAGGAVAIGRAVGGDDVYAIRVAFFLLSCLTVVAVYLAGLSLFRSPLAGLVGAAAFVTFWGFAIDALGGPNAKTPGVLFAVLATALVAHRSWLWAGVAASLALLVWQPLVIYGVVALVAAWISSPPEERLRNFARAAIGAAIPGVATLAYFVAVGAFGELFEAAFLLPVTGTERADTTFGQHVTHIAKTVQRGYGPSSILLWGGLLVLLGLVTSRIWQQRRNLRALAADPLPTVVLPPVVFIAAFSLIDFQGYPDAYPFLPYAALGVAGGAAASLRALDGHRLQPAARTLVGAAAVVLVIAAGAWYSQPRPEAGALVAQRRDAAEADAALGPGGTLYALGNPAPLALMERTNPSRYIYFAAGVDRWIFNHFPGGFEGWMREFAERHRPDMVIDDSWTGDYAARMRRWLRVEYAHLRIGQWSVFVRPELLERAVRSGTSELIR